MQQTKPGKARALSFTTEDSMKPVVIIQNCEVESPGTIGAYLQEREIPFRVVRSFAGEQLPEPDEVGVLVVLGTPTSVTDYRKHDFLVDLFTLMTQKIRREQPILGICFGAQILAHALGARVEANKVKEIGAMPVTLTEDGAADPLFGGFDREFPVFQWHGDTFRIPFGATWMAQSSDCKNQAFRKGNLVGVQFHLEADLSEAPRWCDAYAKELAEEGRTKDEILSSYSAVAEQTCELGFRFLDNFFKLVM